MSGAFAENNNGAYRLKEAEPVIGDPMNRKEFLASAGKYCVGCCAGALMGGFMGAEARGDDQSDAGPAEKSRAETRIKFAEKWLCRFFDILENTLDQKTMRQIMEANGRKCFKDWIHETGRTITPITLEQLAERVAKDNQDGAIRIEGNVIHFQFTSAAETGLPSEEGQCLCPLVETKPAGLSDTYCDCSVGYIKEWHEQLLARPAEVELVESVLRGGKRCRFKITVV